MRTGLSACFAAQKSQTKERYNLDFLARAGLYPDTRRNVKLSATKTKRHHNRGLFKSCSHLQTEQNAFTGDLFCRCTEQ